MRIGLFDSGVGGLTVLNSFIKYHPNNQYFYYGDTEHVPYGEKTTEQLYEYVKEIIKYLKEKEVDMIVIACGTVSANLYDRLKEELDIPIYSVISELPKYIEEKKYKKTLVMATNATINSHVFKKILNNDVVEVACPKLVPIIESGNYDLLDEALDEYLKDLDGVDSIILGCTHYPIVRDYIRNKVGESIDIIDMGEVLAQNIDVIDSNKRIDLFFSKKTNQLNDNVNKILKSVKLM